MNRGLIKRLKEFENNQRLVVIYLSSSCYLGLASGIVKGVRKDHVLVKESVTGNTLLIPLHRIQSLECPSNNR